MAESRKSLEEGNKSPNPKEPVSNSSNSDDFIETDYSMTDPIRGGQIHIATRSVPKLKTLSPNSNKYVKGKSPEIKTKPKDLEDSGKSAEREKSSPKQKTSELKKLEQQKPPRITGDPVDFDLVDQKDCSEEEKSSQQKKSKLRSGEKNLPEQKSVQQKDLVVEIHGFVDVGSECSIGMEREEFQEYEEEDVTKRESVLRKQVLVSVHETDFDLIDEKDCSKEDNSMERKEGKVHRDAEKVTEKKTVPQSSLVTRDKMNFELVNKKEYSKEEGLVKQKEFELPDKEKDNEDSAVVIENPVNENEHSCGETETKVLDSAAKDRDVA